MAIIKCPECGKDISDQAGRCPHCGTDPQIKAKVVGALLVAAAVIFLAVHYGEGHKAEQARQEQYRRQQAMRPTPTRRATVPSIDNISTEANLSYTVVKITDVSMWGGAIKRIRASVVVQDGTSEAELKEAMGKAAVDLAEKYQSVATAVLGYRSMDDFEAGWPAGTAIYAPNGKWGDADKTEDPKSVSIEILQDKIKH